MFLRRKIEKSVYPCKPQFYYIKEGFKGVKIIKACLSNSIGWHYGPPYTTFSDKMQHFVQRNWIHLIDLMPILQERQTTAVTSCLLFRKPIPSENDLF